MADLRDAVWFISTKTVDKETIGGGLCIDSRGFVLTVAHVVSFDGVEQDDCVIEASVQDSDQSFTVERVETHPQFDLALLEVSRKNHDRSPFPHVDLANSVQVDFGEDVFGYVHQAYLTYSLRSGYTCFPLPEELHLPDINDTTTINSYQPFEFRESCSRQAPDRRLFNKNNWVSSNNYRTMGSVISHNDTSLFDYHPRLPLVQVKGYVPSYGTSGCPLFRKRNNELIGLASCEMNEYLFLIPVNFLRKYYDIVKWDILP